MRHDLPLARIDWPPYSPQHMEKPKHLAAQRPPKTPRLVFLAYRLGLLHNKIPKNNMFRLHIQSIADLPQIDG